MSIKMKVHVYLMLWCVVIFTEQCLIGGECVQRRLGACRTLTTEFVFFVNEFQSPPPNGFLLKTSMEIDLLENKHTFENNHLVEKKRPVSYNLDNAALVTIKIVMDVGNIRIHLGKKYYRLAELEYYNKKTNLSERKYSRYNPILPTFPYNLDLEMTTSKIEEEDVLQLFTPIAQYGTFSVFADGNNEPFFEYQVNERLYVDFITFDTEGNNNDLIAFLDCSVKYKTHCGWRRFETLYGCGEWFVGNIGVLKNFDGFQKTYEKDVLFDEFIVVDNEYSSLMKFYFEHHHVLYIDKEQCTT